MSNPIILAIQRLESNIYKVVKARLVKEGPNLLIGDYNDFLDQRAVPKKRKSGRRYFEQPAGPKLRRLYGNLTEALGPKGEGNITQVEVINGAVVFISGIDEDTRVKAGPDTVSLEYTRWHEEGTSRYKARPFLRPGFEQFNKQTIPDIIEQIEDDLVRLYNGR